ncbi:MAG: tetratricopeptide repeat protein [Deltaproteobacteria bacterium]|nr:tetratricopeptide repeat protein [Deltaproteobacteria bacterium]
MAERPEGPVRPSDGEGEREVTPRQSKGSGADDTQAEATPLGLGFGQGPTPPAADFDRDKARAKLKASLFQIETESPRVGRYPILSRLGQGGMGVVYSAYDEDLDRKVAVKVVLGSRESSTAHDRMRREAQAMARLSHPNIVSVHEVGEHQGQVYIAMEFVRGHSLDVWAREHARGWAEIVAVYRLAGRGLQAAHEVDLVHRDFKPHNVMVGDNGDVKVLDFGLARDERSFTRELLSPTEASSLLDRPLTRTGAMVGTPAYMAPEQHLGEPATAYSDQFSFCVSLFHSLHGEYPFEGTSLYELVDSICEGRFRSMDDGRVPGWVQRVLQHGLSQDPAQRFPSMAQLLDALGRDPHARRRRRVVLGGAIALVFAGGVGVSQLAQAPDDACPDAQLELGGVWDSARRDGIATAMRRVGSPQAEPTWTRVEPALDGYADAWVDARREACEDHRAHRSSDLLHDRTVACLSRSRAGLQALTEALQVPDDDTLDKAVAAVAGLPPLSRCRDADALLAEVTPPPAGVAEEVAQLRQQLSAAASLENLGRLPESLASAHQVLGRAVELDYGPLRAEALLRLGSAQLTAGQATEADDNLGEATWLAVEVDHEAIAAEAAARRIYARSELLGKPAEAMVEVPWARALAQRVGDARLIGLMLNNAGAVALRTGPPEQALALFERALEVKRAALPSTDPELALTLAAIGRVQYEHGKSTEAVATLRQAASDLEQALGSHHPQRGLVATMLGSALIEQGRYEDARAELELAEAIVEQRGPSSTMAQYYVWWAQGELALARHRWAEADRHLQQARAIAVSQVGADHPMLGDVFSGRATAAAGRGDHEQALALARQAVEHYERSLGPQHRYVAKAVQVLGEVQLGAGETQAAYESFGRLQEIVAAADPMDEAELGRAKVWVGQAASRLGQLERGARLVEEGLAALRLRHADDAAVVLESLRIAAEVEGMRGNHEAAVEALTAVERTIADRGGDDASRLADVRWRLERARVLQRTEPAQEHDRLRAIEGFAAVLEGDPGFAREAEQARRWLSTQQP